LKASAQKAVPTKDIPTKAVPTKAVLKAVPTRCIIPERLEQLLHRLARVHNVLDDQNVLPLEVLEVVGPDDLDLTRGRRVLVALETDKVHRDLHALVVVAV
jgi:hypothetical protein